MKTIAEYQGKLLNHMQGFYRSGDRDLAVELMQALGLTVVDVPITDTMSLVRVHMNADDKDNVDNVMFLAEMPPAQAKLESLLQARVKTDRELGDALDGYFESAKNGDNSPHFGLHYRTSTDLEQAMDRVTNDLSPALKDRVTLTEMPSYGAVADFPDIRQVFVRTDVFAFGSTTLGQTIELQVERGA